jgi:hypothetical protein
VNNNNNNNNNVVRCKSHLYNNSDDDNDDDDTYYLTFLTFNIILALVLCGLVAEFWGESAAFVCPLQFLERIMLVGVAVR